MPRFRIKSPQVIHETIEGEAVIVNLETGHYYMLTGTGERIWAAIARDASVEDILVELSAAYENGDDHVEAPVTTFLDELAREGLIVPSHEQAEASRHAGPLAPPAGDRAPFTAPALQKFQDMKELILLDPVHEVHEDLGWPHPKPAP